jgi:hypothetical protein
LVDWGAYRATADKNQRCVRFLARLIEHYQPRVVLFESRDRRERQRSERIRGLVRSATNEVRKRGIVVERIPRGHVRRFFERHGGTTKQQVATSIVELLPELSQYLPPLRKPWMPEHRAWECLMQSRSRSHTFSRMKLIYEAPYKIHHCRLKLLAPRTSFCF